MVSELFDSDDQHSYIQEVDTEKIAIQLCHMQLNCVRCVT